MLVEKCLAQVPAMAILAASLTANLILGGGTPCAFAAEARTTGSQTQDVAMETLVIQHEGMHRTPSQPVTLQGITIQGVTLQGSTSTSPGQSGGGDGYIYVPVRP